MRRTPAELLEDLRFVGGYLLTYAAGLFIGAWGEHAFGPAAVVGALLFGALPIAFLFAKLPR